MNTSQQTPDTNPENTSPEDAEAALAENRRREAQTVAEGSTPWPARVVVPFALALVPLGFLIDMDMIWLFAVLVGLMAAFAVRRRVQLRTDQRSERWDVALLGTFVAAFGADIAVQFVVRGADVPLPNTIGMAAAAVVVLALTWPVQRAAATRVRA